MTVMTCPPGVAALFGLVKSRRGANEIQRPIGCRIKRRGEAPVTPEHEAKFAPV